jgi:hypothetical protein
MRHNRVKLRIDDTFIDIGAEPKVRAVIDVLTTLTGLR